MLVLRKSRKEPSAGIPVKYRGPNGEEWSGRGRQPKWLTVMEAQGKTREDYRVSA